MGSDRDVRLVGKTEPLQHGATVVAIVPDGNKNEFRFRVFLRHFQPATILQLSLAIRAPRRPQMDHGKVRRFDRIAHLLIGGRLGVNGTGRDQRSQDGKA